MTTDLAYTWTVPRRQCPTTPPYPTPSVAMTSTTGGPQTPKVGCKGTTCNSFSNDLYCEDGTSHTTSHCHTLS